MLRDSLLHWQNNQISWVSNKMGQVERETQILDAAERVFMRFGPRRTTMEDVADEVGFSRPAIYQYFRNKKDLLRLVVDRLHRETLKSVAQELDRPGSIRRQLVAGLEARDGRLFEYCPDSGLTPWFLDTAQKDVHDIISNAQRMYEGLLRRHMTKSGYSEQRASVTAKLLVGTAAGLRAMAGTREEFDQLIATSVDQLIAGADQLEMA